MRQRKSKPHRLKVPHSHSRLKAGKKSSGSVLLSLFAHAVCSSSTRLLIGGLAFVELDTWLGNWRSGVKGRRNRCRLVRIILVEGADIDCAVSNFFHLVLLIVASLDYQLRCILVHLSFGSCLIIYQNSSVSKLPNQLANQSLESNHPRILKRNPSDQAPCIQSSLYARRNLSDQSPHI